MAGLDESGGERMGEGFYPRDILRHTQTRVFGRRIYSLAETDSTNRVAADLARSGEMEGTIVLANYQTSGRGRWERRWESPPGRNVLFSLILRPDAPAVEVLPVTLSFSAAVAEVLGTLTGRDVGVKWPNDVVVGGRKICGILSEGSTLGERTEFVVVGVGINVNMRLEEFSDECRHRSCSCYTLTGREWDRVTVLVRVLAALERAHDAFTSRGFSALVGEYKSRLAVLGCDVGYRSRGRDTVARVVDVAADGGLVVVTPDGVSTLYDDEVTMLVVREGSG